MVYLLFIIYYNNNLIFYNIIKIIIFIFCKWGLGIGDWGLGIGDWG